MYTYLNSENIILLTVFFLFLVICVLLFLLLAHPSECLILLRELQLQSLEFGIIVRWVGLP